MMNKSKINKKIKRIEERYYKACNRINNKYHTKIEQELDIFRMKCVNEVFRLKDKDKEIQKLKRAKAGV